MRPVKVTIGPSLTSTANNIATSQTPVAAASSATATFTNSSASIAATNSFVAGQIVYFTTTGQLPYPLIAGAPYYVISTGLSGSNFEVAGSYGGTGIVFNTASVGTPGNPPWSYFPAASGTQTVNYGGIVALNGSLVAAGVAVLATPQRVLITTSDTTTTFTLIGTGSSGTPQSETLINTSTSIQSNLDYATITSIKVSQGTTAAITVGTNGVGSTPWVRFDDWSVAPVAIQCNVTGTVNYTVQSSLDDPNSAFGTPVTPAAMTWNNTNDSNAVNATSTVQTSFYTGVPVFARVLLNSGSGSVTATFTQSGVVPY